MIGVDASSVAWAALAACSGAIDGTIRLQMKRADPGFTVPPPLWVVLTGDPSTRKSPTLETAFAPVNKIQGERIRAYERELQLWEKQDPETRGRKPRFDQLITHDATTEGVRDLLVTQERGSSPITTNGPPRREHGEIGAARTQPRAFGRSSTSPTAAARG